jgi:hypothetical protein
LDANSSSDLTAKFFMREKKRKSWWRREGSGVQSKRLTPHFDLSYSLYAASITLQETPCASTHA